MLRLCTRPRKSTDEALEQPFNTLDAQREAAEAFISGQRLAWEIMSVMSGLSSAINDAVVRRLAGERSYDRGLDYYRNGRVESLEEWADGVRAVVSGTQDYTVRLSSDEGVLDYNCDCPYGSDGTFCKHCVAAALAWLNRGSESAKAARRGKVKEITPADAEKVLLLEGHEQFVRMVMDWAKDDDKLRERVMLLAARRSGPEAGVAAGRRAFERAVRVRDFVDYREASSWARGVDDAIDSIAQLLSDGQAPAVIELCESALHMLVEVSDGIDDSDGHLSVLRDRLQDIHFQACKVARPDPVALAKRLFDWELHSELDVFFGAVAQYSEILGANGLQAYRQLAEEEWKKVPAQAAKDERAEWGKHFRITHIMESLARSSGNVDELVAVMSRDLSHAYSYLRIAEVHKEARQHDLALQWAERGLKAFPDRTDGRLREFAAEEYHRRRRHDEAMKLIWAEFSERPNLETYQTLERHAKKSGNWPEWRERALAEFRGRIANAKEKSRGQSRTHWMRAEDDHSLLVEVFLYEGEVETAWREAQAGGCSSDLWLRLAAKREKDHPEDAVPIYMRQAESAIVGARNSRYDESVSLLVKAAALMKRMGRSEEFVRQLEALRLKYKIKRNFIKLLDQKQKSLYMR